MTTPASAKRYFWHPRIKLVSVESGIAGGKSTLLLRMQALVPTQTGGKWRAWFVQEPVATWLETGALAQFYADPEQRAAEFQALTFATRIGALADAYHEAHAYAEATPDAHAVIVTERSPFADRDVFAYLQCQAGNIKPTQHAAYLANFASWQRVTQGRAYDLYVWLDTPVTESQRRFATRAREGEAVPDKYAQALYARHAELFGGSAKRYLGAPVLRIDGMAELHTCDRTLLNAWEQVRGALALTQ